MKKILLLIVCLSVCFNGFAQYEGEDDGGFATFGDDDNSPDPLRDFFGFVLLPGSNDLVRFYEIHINDDSTMKYTQLSMDGFVNRAAGRERSSANPSKDDFFRNFGVKDYNIVSKLWMLRYKEYPYFTQVQHEPGWSNNDEYPELPSPQQFAILKQFGIERLSSICYGDKCFMLLACMENPEWVNRYKGSAMTTPSADPQNGEDNTFVD
ncbi:MAG: hypothetical protein VZQ51_00895 [Bacteroidales bacterium]|nr:hypothetical protein [Bacteroidales bacterium]